MCIIVVKKDNISFPKKDILKNCFDNNPDGAGYMLAVDNKVIIKKGFDTFNKFWKSLSKTRKTYGDSLPYIMHFRISTQAHGRMDCTHPFPLSAKMGDLRALDTTCNIGIAHNGIISLTSSYGYGYNKTITYSDTMEFITDYLTLIIENEDYYKDQNKLKLIEKLCESKLAILDKNGHIELIGSGFVEDNGIIYSNTSYKTYKIKATYVSKTTSNATAPSYFYGGKNSFSSQQSKSSWDSYFDEYDKQYYDDYEEFYDYYTGEYDFTEVDCPVSWGDGYDYCQYCKRYNQCYDIENDENDKESDKGGDK